MKYLKSITEMKQMNKLKLNIIQFDGVKIIKIKKYESGAFEDLIKIFDYCVENGKIQNYTISGVDIPTIELNDGSELFYDNFKTLFSTTTINYYISMLNKILLENSTTKTNTPTVSKYGLTKDYIPFESEYSRFVDYLNDGYFIYNGVNSEGGGVGYIINNGYNNIKKFKRTRNVEDAINSEKDIKILKDLMKDKKNKIIAVNDVYGEIKIEPVSLQYFLSHVIDYTEEVIKQQPISKEELTKYYIDALWNIR